ncbi:hypothetical protein ACEPAG_2203 [Sanghuangporus baumii]
MWSSFATALWGIGCLQLYFYYEKYWKTDQRWLRAFIFLIWTLDTAHQALILQSNYVIFVHGIGDILLLLHVSKTTTSAAMLAALIDAMVQIVLVRRAWYLSRKKHALRVILCVAVLAQFVVTTVFFAQIHNFSNILQFMGVVNTELVMSCIALATDTLLAGVLIWLLWKARSGFHRSDSIINRLVIYTVDSGLVTAFWATVAVIGTRVAPNSFIYLLVDLVMPKLYFNCMLASLNARLRLRATAGIELGNMSIRLGNLSSASAERSNSSAGRMNKISSSRPVECRIDIATESRSDDLDGKKPENIVPQSDESGPRTDASAC